MLPCTQGLGEKRGKAGMFLDSCLNKQMGGGVSACGREQRNRLQRVENKKSVSVIIIYLYLYYKFSVMCNERLYSLFTHIYNKYSRRVGRCLKSLHLEV